MVEDRTDMERQTSDFPTPAEARDQLQKWEEAGIVLDLLQENRLEEVGQRIALYPLSTEAHRALMTVFLAKAKDQPNLWRGHDQFMPWATELTRMSRQSIGDQINNLAYWRDCGRDDRQFYQDTISLGWRTVRTFRLLKIDRDQITGLIKEVTDLTAEGAERYLRAENPDLVLPEKWQRFHKRLPADALAEMNKLWDTLTQRIIDDPQAGLDTKTGKRRTAAEISSPEIVGLLCATVYNAWGE